MGSEDRPHATLRLALGAEEGAEEFAEVARAEMFELLYARREGGCWRVSVVSTAPGNLRELRGGQLQLVMPRSELEDPEAMELADAPEPRRPDSSRVGLGAFAAAWAERGERGVMAIAVSGEGDDGWVVTAKAFDDPEAGREWVRRLLEEGGK